LLPTATDSMIWREMCGSGAGIGMGMILLRYRRILAAQLRVRGGYSEVVLGTTMRSIAALRLLAVTVRPTRAAVSVLGLPAVHPPETAGDADKPNVGFEGRGEHHFWGMANPGCGGLSPCPVFCVWYRVGARAGRTRYGNMAERFMHHPRLTSTIGARIERGIT
jgi:hypothetical protein